MGAIVPNYLQPTGWTGLEPAASGVTVRKGGIAGGSTGMQPVEIVHSGVTGSVQKSQRLATILDGLLTTFLQGFMTVAQVAARLGVCRSTVYQLCERGELVHVRVSNAIRVPVAAVAEYLRQQSD